MIASLDLLRKLASGIRPDGSTPSPGSSPIERDRFERLLSRARSGELASGRRLHAAPGVGEVFDEHVMEQLSQAADAAEAAGADRLLAWVGERMVRIDVPHRELQGVGGAEPGRVVTGFDAAVFFPGADESSVRPGGPRGVINAGLAEFLARGVRDTPDAAVADGRLG